jgi:hypothetical protein
MHTRMTISRGFAAALLAIAAMQFPEAALALNPQPEVPSMPKPDPEPHPDPALKLDHRIIKFEKSKAKRFFAPRSVTVPTSGF